MCLALSALFSFFRDLSISTGEWEVTMKSSAAAVFLCLGLALGLVSTNASAATLNVIGGQLVGASDVNVGGQLYDVEFVEGTCIGLFDGCDSASDFEFATIGGASQASQALFSQVLLDGGSGAFDSDPELTLGCESEIECRIITPYRISPFDTVTLFYVYPHNQSNNALDTVVAGTGGALAGISRTRDTSTEDNFVFAKWSVVPEPSSALLVGLGLVGLGAARRRESASR
jgi:hypothetical protein